MLLYTIKLFKEQNKIKEYYNDKFKHIFVDEYQDTNYIQQEWLKLITGNDINKNITCVGDDDQSIYGWRGAQIKNILNFTNNFTNAKILKLERNYRSTQNILDAANKVSSGEINLSKLQDMPVDDARAELMKIKGVGPKVALAILSELSSEQIALSVSASDYKTLTRASGVGPKLAQRIVLELKDKIKGISVDTADGVVTKGSVIADTGNIPKAVQALAVLGYSAADVTPVLSKLDPSMTVEQLIAATLRQMG